MFFARPVFAIPVRLLSLENIAPQVRGFLIDDSVRDTNRVLNGRKVLRDELDHVP